MLTIIRTTSDHPDFKDLVQRLDKELWKRYGAIQAEYDKHNKIETKDAVLVAYLNSLTVGCGCFRMHGPHTVEIKRMFVEPGERGKGIAFKIVSELCSWAAELGIARAILETGLKQPEAINLYLKAGFAVIPNYAPYIGNDNSVCMEKILPQV